MRSDTHRRFAPGVGVVLLHHGDRHWRAAEHRVAAAASHKALRPYLRMPDGTDLETAPSPGQRTDESGIGHQ